MYRFNYSILETLPMDRSYGTPPHKKICIFNFKRKKKHKNHVCLKSLQKKNLTRFRSNAILTMSEKVNVRVNVRFFVVIKK